MGERAGVFLLVEVWSRPDAVARVARGTRQTGAIEGDS